MRKILRNRSTRAGELAGAAGEDEPCRHHVAVAAPGDPALYEFGGLFGPRLQDLADKTAAEGALRFVAENGSPDLFVFGDPFRLQVAVAQFQLFGHFKGGRAAR